MTRTIEDLIPDYLRGLPVYVPGKPIEEVERELKIHAVKLASNEILWAFAESDGGGAGGARGFEPVSGWRDALAAAVAGGTAGSFAGRDFRGLDRARLLIWLRGCFCEPGCRD